MFESGVYTGGGRDTIFWTRVERPNVVTYGWLWLSSLLSLLWKTLTPAKTECTKNDHTTGATV